MYDYKDIITTENIFAPSRVENMILKIIMNPCFIICTTRSIYRNIKPNLQKYEFGVK